MPEVDLYSIGHSNHDIDAWLSRLQVLRIQCLVDVRAYPESRRYPQFSSDALRASLEQAGMRYHWAGRQLGGRRKPRDDSPHVALAPDGLRAYADYMDTEGFQQAATQLINLASKATTVMMCAEGDPKQCHRSLIADYLTLRGVDVVHILADGALEKHLLSPRARRESASLVYDRLTSAPLDFR